MNLHPQHLQSISQWETWQRSVACCCHATPSTAVYHHGNELIERIPTSWQLPPAPLVCPWEANVVIWVCPPARSNSAHGSRTSQYLEINFHHARWRWGLGGGVGDLTWPPLFSVCFKLSRYVPSTWVLEQAMVCKNHCLRYVFRCACNNYPSLPDIRNDAQSSLLNGRVSKSQ